MDIEKILIQKFAAPLKDNYKRRIIFWKDPEREFEDAAEGLNIEGVELLKLNGSNYFEAKKRILRDAPEQNFLIYDPCLESGAPGGVIVDIELYSEIFHADLASMRMEELRIPNNEKLRRAVKKYLKFFNNKDRLGKFASFGTKYKDEADIDLNVLTVLTGAKNNSPEDVIRAVLKQGFILDENEALIHIEKFGDTAAWYDLTERTCGISRGDLDEDYLFTLAARLIITALSANMGEAALSPWREYICPEHAPFCYSLVHEWTSGEDEDYLKIAREVENRLDIPNKFAELEPADFKEADCLPCINESILKVYLSQISEQTIKSDEIKPVIEKRRSLKWYGKFENYFEAVLQAAEMDKFLKSFKHLIRGMTSYDVMWKQYVNEFMFMDTHFRRFHTAFEKCLKTDPSSDLSDLLKNAAEYADNLYKNGYLKVLTEEWIELASEQLEQAGALENGIETQDRFYNAYVRPVLKNENNKAFVIISDALRYEIGCELCKKLNSETKGNAEIKSMQSAIPSITKLGMASLLPHNKLTLDKNFNPLCDNISTQSRAERQKVLQTVNKDNAAVGAADFFAMTREERRNVVKAAQTVYIYHNKIDAAGDKPQSENETGQACEEAVKDIINIVKIITGELSGTNIFITADHGFIYTLEPLPEHEKISNEIPEEDIIEKGRRYIIAKTHKDESGFVEIPLTQWFSDWCDYSARGILKIKMSGGGEKYVHGGISLQELVIPVITYKNVKHSSKKFVEVKKAQIAYIGTTKRITNTIFKLDFNQTEAVGEKIAPAEYEVYIVDDKGTLVSDVKKVIADNADTHAPNRSFKERFTLKSVNFDKNAPYYLIIKELSKGVTIQKITFKIDVAFENDFDL